MAVPYTFGSATASIPLSQLDSNFATTITLGNTAIQLGNTVTTLNNMTLANVTISSGTSSLQANVANATGTLPVGNGGLGITTTPSNGYIPIGNGTNYTAAAITAGSGITVTNASGSITIASTGGAGTVTSIATNNGLTGGTITTSGTIGIDVYNGTTAAYTSYAIGTSIIASNNTGGVTKTPNNSNPTWYAGSSDPTRFASGTSSPSGGSALSGTWRYRGAAICDNVWLLTRTA